MSWLCLLAFMLACVVATVAIVVALMRVRWARTISWLVLVLALMPAGLGVVGMGLGRAKVERVLEFEGIDPEMRERIREEGFSEAGQCINVGSTLTAAPLMMAIIALVLAYALKRREPDAPA